MAINGLKNLRDFIACWNQIGQRIAHGDIIGAQVAMVDSQGHVTYRLCGVYEDDIDQARKAALLTAWELTPATPSNPPMPPRPKLRVVRSGP